MLISENLLRRMIQHTLTQKILKEQQSSINSKPEGDEEGVAAEITLDHAIEQEEDQEEESDAKSDNILEGKLLNDLNNLNNSLNNSKIKDVKIFDDFLDFLGNLLNIDAVWEKFTEIYKLFYNSSEDFKYKKAIKLIFACLNQKNSTEDGFKKFQNDNSAYGFKYTKTDDESISEFLNNEKKNQIKIAMGLIYSNPNSTRKRTAEAKKNIPKALKEFRKLLSNGNKLRKIIELINLSAKVKKAKNEYEIENPFDKDDSSTPSNPKQNTQTQSKQDSKLSDDNQFENKDDTNMNPKQNVIEVRPY